MCTRQHPRHNPSVLAFFHPGQKTNKKGVVAIKETDIHHFPIRHLPFVCDKCVLYQALSLWQTFHDSSIHNADSFIIQLWRDRSSLMFILKLEQNAVNKCLKLILPSILVDCEGLEVRVEPGQLIGVCRG